MQQVEAKIAIRTSPAAVFSAFTELEHLHGWWGVERKLIELKPGGLYTLIWQITENGIGFVSTGIMKVYKPEKRLLIGDFVYINPEKPILGPMSLTLETTQKSNYTELKVTQDGYQKGEDWDWYYEAVKNAWPMALETLKNYLEK